MALTLPPQLAAFAHNPLALGGAAAVTGLGLWHLHKTKAAGGATGTGTVATGSVAATGSDVGGAATFPNTSATDLATAVGNLDGKYADQVAAYGAQLSSVDTSLAALGTKVAGMPNPTKVVYAVQKGQTQKQIAAMFGTTVAALEAANPVIQPKGSKVSTGMKLTIPGR